MIFAFAVSGNRSDQGFILSEINWKRSLVGTSLQDEITRQSNFYNSGDPEGVFDQNNLTDFYIFLGNAIRHFDNVGKSDTLQTMHEILKVVDAAFSSTDVFFSMWIRMNTRSDTTLKYFRPEAWKDMLISSFVPFEFLEQKGIGSG